MGTSKEPIAGEAPAQQERKITSIEDARLLIMKMNGLPIPESDPLMMLVSLLLAFTDDYNAMLTRHNKAVSTTMKGIVSAASTELNKEIHQFGEELRSTTLQNVILLISEHKAEMVRHAASMRQLTYLCLGLSFIVVFVSFGVLLWKVLAA